MIKFTYVGFSARLKPRFPEEHARSHSHAHLVLRVMPFQKSKLTVSPSPSTDVHVCTHCRSRPRPQLMFMYAHTVVRTLFGNHHPCSGTICMEEYKDQDEIRFLPCMHFYHQDCIDDWLPRNMTCPICGDSLETQLAGTQ